MVVRKLAENITKRGFDYALVERNDKVCLYSQSCDGRIMSYEVFKVKLSKPHPKSPSVGVHDKVEVYPQDEDFGHLAWTYRDYSTAKEAYDRLSDPAL